MEEGYVCEINIELAYRIAVHYSKQRLQVLKSDIVGRSTDVGSSGNTRLEAVFGLSLCD